MKNLIFILSIVFIQVSGQTEVVLSKEQEKVDPSKLYGSKLEYEFFNSPSNDYKGPQIVSNVFSSNVETTKYYEFEEGKERAVDVKLIFEVDIPHNNIIMRNKDKTIFSIFKIDEKHLINDGNIYAVKVLLRSKYGNMYAQLAEIPGKYFHFTMYDNKGTMVVSYYWGEIPLNKNLMSKNGKNIPLLNPNIFDK